MRSRTTSNHQEHQQPSPGIEPDLDYGEGKTREQESNNSLFMLALVVLTSFAVVIGGILVLIFVL